MSRSDEVSGDVRLSIAVMLLGVVISPRLIHTRLPHPGLLYALYAVAAVVLVTTYVRLERLRKMLATPAAVAILLGSFCVALLLIYPVVDGRKSVGMGSDQDDCIRDLVRNTFSGKTPYSPTYLDHPCSAGPIMVLPYAPAAFFDNYFALVPPLVLLFAWFHLRRHVRIADVLIYTQLICVSFLELAAQGSDFIPIAWAYALGAWGASRALASGDRRQLWLAGALLVFASGSRVPLLYLGPAVAFLLVTLHGRKAWPLLAATITIPLASYALFWSITPSPFPPLHVFGKITWLLTPLPAGIMVAAAFVAALGLATLALRRGWRRNVQGHYLWFCAALLFAPMVFTALGELIRRRGDFSHWEGSGYLYLALPAVLLALLDRQPATSPDPGTNLPITPP